MVMVALCNLSETTQNTILHTTPGQRGRAGEEDNTQRTEDNSFVYCCFFSSSNSIHAFIGTANASIVCFVQINLIKIYCNITPEKILDLSGKDCLFRNFHLFSFCKIASFGVFTNRNRPWQNWAKSVLRVIKDFFRRWSLALQYIVLSPTCKI